MAGAGLKALFDGNTCLYDLKEKKSLNVTKNLRIFLAIFFNLLCCVCPETMDFSSMTLTQIKRQEMDAQVSAQQILLKLLHCSFAKINLKELSHGINSEIIGAHFKI